MKAKTAPILFVVALMMSLFVTCAPNNEMYLSKPAGFWAGLWHGLIVVITFIISLFTDSVTIYEVNNTGGWYNFGFVVGLLISLGNGHVRCPIKKKSEREHEWEEIGHKVEEKVRTGIQKWLDEAEEKDEEWEEIGKKVEEKIKRELKNWAEK